eukprot:m.219484 g.219484  ORF g.219484 m.219484 type:complete len:3572 (+) comp13825_c8_seq1:160-10875(+)
MRLMLTLFVAVAFVTNIVFAEGPWQEGELSFAGNAQGWAGTNLARVYCSSPLDRYILGGYDGLGYGAFLHKLTTNLPAHNALRIQLKYVFLRSWDYERARVYVEDDLKWSYTYTLRNAQGTFCGGRATFVKDVDIIIPQHTMPTTYIRVTSTLDQAGYDEAFAITAVEITPFMRTIGNGVLAFPQDNDFSFSGDAVNAWVSNNGKKISCGGGDKVALSVSGGEKAFLHAEFTDLPTHNAYLIKATIRFIHSAGQMALSMTANRAVVYSDAVYSGGGLISDDVCGSQLPSVDIEEFVILDREETIAVDIIASIVDSSYIGETPLPQFILEDFSIVLIPNLGVLPISSKPDNFDLDLQGWFGPYVHGVDEPSVAERHKCASPFSTILGGLSTRVLNSRIVKTFSDIPSHYGVLVSLTYFFLGWERRDVRGKLLVDNELKWAATPTEAGALDGEECGYRTESLEFTLYLQSHTSDTIFLDFRSDGRQYDQEGFGIWRPKVTPLTFVSDSTDLGIGTYDESSPRQNIMQSGFDKWISPGARVVQCSSDSQLLKVTGYDTIDAFVAKNITNLPTHDHVRVSYSFAFLQNSGTQSALLFVDGSSRFREDHTTNGQSSSSSNNCSSTDTRIISVFAIFPHSASSASVVIQGRQEVGSGVFGIADLEVEHIVSGSRKWSDRVDDFTQWTEGWIGTGGRSLCGPYGSIYGGPCIGGMNQVLQKEYTDLPQHTVVHVELDVFFLNTWDDEAATVLIDGQEAWSFNYNSRNYESTICGGTQTYVHRVSISLVHSASSITVKVTTGLNQSPCDEGFGIDNVRVTPANINNNGITQASWVEGEADFSTFKYTAPWLISRKKLKPSCDKVFFATSSTTSSTQLNVSPFPGTSSGFARGVFTNLPAHNAIRIFSEVAFLHTSGIMRVLLTANAVNLWGGELESVGIVKDECGGLSATQLIDVTLSHSGDSVDINFAASISEIVKRTNNDGDVVVGTQDVDDSVLPVFGIRAFSIEPLTLGTEKFVAGETDTFDEWADFWYHSANNIRTKCTAPLGPVFGGVGLYAKNAQMGKTYTDLPTHTGLLVLFTYVFLNVRNTGAVGRLHVDGNLVWKESYSNFPNEGTFCESKKTAYTRLRILVPDHDANKVSFSVSSYSNFVYANEDFAIKDFSVVPIVTVGGAGVSKYSVDNKASFDSGDVDAWIGTNLDVASCGTPLGNMLISTGGGPAFISKKFVNLPSHTIVRIELTVLPMQRPRASSVSVNDMIAELVVDEEVVWRKVFEDEDDVVAVSCDASDASGKIVSVVVFAPHTKDALELQLWGDAARGKFAVDDISLLALTPGMSAWTPTASSFQYWSDNWVHSYSSFTKLPVTNCGSDKWGWILGGVGVFAGSGDAQKEYTKLPTHSSVQVTLSLLLFGTWSANEFVGLEIDERVVWRQIVDSSTFAKGDVCGNGDVASHQHVDIDVVLLHNASFISIKVGTGIGSSTSSSSLTATAAWGIANVVVTPFNTTLGTGHGVWVSSDPMDFSSVDAVKPFHGVNLAQRQCKDDFFTLLTSTAISSKASDPAIISTTLTGISTSHNSIVVKGIFVPLTTSGNITYSISESSTVVDGFPQSLTVVPVDVDGTACPSGVGFEATISHTSTSLVLTFSAESVEGEAAAFGIAALEVIPTQLGVRTYTDAMFTFASDTQGWYGSGNQQRTFCGEEFGWILGGQRTTMFSTSPTARVEFTNVPSSHNYVIMESRFYFFNVYNNPSATVEVLSVLSEGGAQGVVLQREQQGAVLVSSSPCGFETAYLDLSFVLPHNGDESNVFAVSIGPASSAAAFPFGVNRARAALLTLVGSGRYAYKSRMFPTYDQWRAPSNSLYDSGSSTCPTMNEGDAITFIRPKADAFAGLITMYNISTPHTFLDFNFKIAFGIDPSSRSNVAKLDSTPFVFARLFMGDEELWSSESTEIVWNCGRSLHSVVATAESDNSTQLLRLSLFSSDPTINVIAYLYDASIVAFSPGLQHWNDRTETFSTWAHSWVGSNGVTVSHCEEQQSILGGIYKLGKDAFAKKTYTNLPAHDSVRIQLEFIFFRTWDFESAFISIDDQVVWTFKFWHQEPDQVTICGVSAKVVDVDIVISNHTASSLDIYVTTNLDQGSHDEAWGIDNVNILPFKQTLGSGLGSWEAATDEDGSIDFTSEKGIDPFAGSSGSYVEQDCGSIVTTSTSATTAAFVKLGFNNLPEHNALRFRYDYIPFIKYDTTDDTYVDMNNSTIYSRVVSSDVVIAKTEASNWSVFQGDANSNDTNVCSFSGSSSPSISVDIFVTHTGSFVEAEMSFTLADSSSAVENGASDPRRASASINNLVVNAITLGIGEWKEGQVSDFSTGPDGWLGAGRLERMKCDGYNWALGGVRTGEKGSISTKRYTNLPEHIGLVVKMKYFLLNWQDNREARVFVDGVLAWSMLRDDIEGEVSTACFDQKTVVVDVFAFVPSHTAPSVYIGVTATSDYFSQESFAIMDVEVLPQTGCEADEFESSAPSPTSTRECSSITQCDSDMGTYLVETATITADTICGDCTVCPPEGYVQVSPCSGTSDTICRSCDTCDVGYFVKKECTSTSDPVCAQCSDCSGDNKFLKFPCSLNSDTVCADCSTCEEGKEYFVKACTPTSDVVCVDYTVCKEDEYESVPVTATTDRQCAQLTECPDTQYSVIQPTPTSDRFCIEYSSCDYSSQYEFIVATPTNDRYCVDLTVCDADKQYEMASPTPTTDRKCAFCSNCDVNNEWIQNTCSRTHDTVCNPCSECRSSEYLIEECTQSSDTVCKTCDTCGEGQYTVSECNVGGNNTVCSDCSKACDFETQFERQSCRGGNDRVCVDLKECDETTEYEASAPTASSDRVCTTCTTCEDGMFEVSVCTATSDRVCSACDLCGMDEFVSTECSATSNTVCTTCDAECEAGVSFEVTACTPSSNRNCVDCNLCGDGVDFFYTQECGLTHDASCDEIVQCETGVEFELTPPTIQSNRICNMYSDPCSTSLGTLQFEDIPPTSTSDRVCKVVTECVDGVEFEAIEPTLSSDRVCATHSVCNTTEVVDVSSKFLQYEFSPATATTQRICARVATCLADVEFEAVPPTPTSNRACEEYSNACNPASEYQTQNATPTSDRICVARTICHFSTEYVVDPGTLSTDRECKDLTVCSSVEFETVAATASSDRECQDITQCGAMEYQTQAPTRSSDRTCEAVTPCDDEEYTAHPYGVANDNHCVPYTAPCSFNDGYYEAISPTATSDRFCAPFSDVCVLGVTYEAVPPTISSDRICQPLRTCGAGSYISRVGDLTSDNVCSPVSQCEEIVLSASTATSDIVCGMQRQLYFDLDYQVVLQNETTFKEELYTKLSDLGFVLYGSASNILLRQGSVVASFFLQVTDSSQRYDSFAAQGRVKVMYGGEEVTGFTASSMFTSSTPSPEGSSGDDPLFAGVVLYSVIGIAALVVIVVVIIAVRFRIAKKVDFAKDEQNVVFENPVYRTNIPLDDEEGDYGEVNPRTSRANSHLSTYSTENAPDPDLVDVVQQTLNSELKHSNYIAFEEDEDFDEDGGYVDVSVNNGGFSTDQGDYEEFDA